MAQDPLVVHVLWGDTLLHTLRLERARAVWARELPLPDGTPDWRIVDDASRLVGLDGSAQAIPVKGDARIDVGTVTVVVERPGPRAFAMRVRPSRAKAVLAASVAVHAGLLAYAAISPGPSPEETAHARFRDIQRYNVAIALRDDPRSDPPDTVEPEEGSMGTRAKGGDSGKRYAVAGPDPHVAHAAALREAADFGMIGLLSTEGGGSGNGGGIGVIGRSSPSAPWGAAPSGPAAAQGPSVRAGEWDDNASYREFMGFLATTVRLWTPSLDVQDRQFVVVRDAEGKPVPSCWLDVRDAQGQKAQLRTTASGRALLFPHAEGVTAPLTVTARCGVGSGVATANALEPDGAIVVDLAAARALPAARRLQIGFILDTTGSMSEEIAEIKSTIHQVSALLAHEQVRLEVGLVEYKDEGDEFVTRAYKLSADLDAFSRTIDHLSAGGGGDVPEAVEDGLRAGLDDLGWSLDATVKMAFLVGDAPPHRIQADRYATQARRYAHAGIPVFTIAASGMDTFGQVVWRQIAQYTGGTNMFVLRGGAGPQSTGAGDPLTSCGTRQTQYTSGNLHQLVVNKVKDQLAAVDADPMRIRGRGQDERPAACARIAQR
jgi:hypothetical protein